MDQTSGAAWGSSHTLAGPILTDTASPQKKPQAGIGGPAWHTKPPKWGLLCHAESCNYKSQSPGPGYVSSSAHQSYASMEVQGRREKIKPSAAQDQRLLPRGGEFFGCPDLLPFYHWGTATSPRASLGTFSLRLLKQYRLRGGHGQPWNPIFLPPVSFASGGVISIAEWQGHLAPPQATWATLGTSHTYPKLHWLGKQPARNSIVCSWAL